MDDDLHNIEDLFRDGLEDNEELPSPKLWNDIDNILDKDKLVSITKKYGNLKKVAMLLLFLLLGLSIYQLRYTHTNEAVAKRNIDGSDTETVNGINDNKRVLSLNTQPQKPLDSISFNKMRVQPDNNNTIKNESSLNGTLNPSNQKDNYNQNITIDNTLIDKSIPNNKFKLGNKYKPENKNKVNTDSNAIADNMVASKNEKRAVTNSSYKLKIKNPGFVEDRQQTTVNDNVESTDQPPQLLKRLNPEGIDKINWQPKDFADTQKLLQSIVNNKIHLHVSAKNIVAANTKNKGSKPSQFSVTVFYSPDIAWYRLQEDKPDNQIDNSAEIAESEQHEFSSTVGALVDYNLSKYWSLQSGLTYSNTNIIVQPKTIFAQSDNAGSIKYRINTSSGYGYVLPSFSSNPNIGDSLYAFTTTHTLKYINIPLALKYTITKGKFSFNGMAGFSTNILTVGKIETTLKKGFNNELQAVDKLYGLKNIYFSGLAGLGLDYKFNKKVAFSFAPTLRFALNSINKDAPVKSYPNTFGLVLGLKIGI